MSKGEKPSGYTILLTDDNLDYLQVTKRLLEREGHTVLTASDGMEALAVLKQKRVDLLLLDYYMPAMTGEQVVTELRQWNRHAQVILQTGYASEQPPRELLRRLDIQGYYDKSEGPDKLLLWTEVGLKAAHSLQLLDRSRQGLRYILEVTPEMHKIQSLSDLLHGILLQVTGLLEAGGLALVPSAIAAKAAPESFLAITEDNDLVIRAGSAHFGSAHRIEQYLAAERLDLVWRAMAEGRTQLADGATVVPLRVSETPTGVMYLDRQLVLDQDVELLQIFANQAAVAIHNTQLYEMATLDPVTGAYLRRFFEQWMMRELRAAYGARQPASLLLVDVDSMKAINDAAGHLAGDEALFSVGKSLKEAVRTSDIVGRYGGDEFAVMLPQTPLAGAERVARRILQLVSEKSVQGAAGELPIAVSLGLAVLEPPHAPPSRPSPRYFEAVAKALFQRADEALYEAKRAGGNRLWQGEALAWGEVSAASA
jgi:two-component system cell cycle response regulator